MAIKARKYPRKVKVTRLRVLITGEMSGQPIPNVVVKVSAEINITKGDDTQEVVLGLRQSSRAGYLSCELGELADDPQLAHIWVSPLAAPEIRIDALPGLRAEVDPVLVNLPVPDDIMPCKGGGSSTLPFAPDPDPLDWYVSSESFTVDPSLLLGEDGCEELLHSREAERIFRFVQLVRDGNEPIELRPVQEQASCESSMEQSEFPAGGTRLSSEGVRCYRLGAMFEYEISWEPLGHSLGRVVYSLPLAPCESVNIAVIEWQRKDEVSRTEDSSHTEQLQHIQRRDRLIEETVRASLNEKQLGGSFMGGFGASGSSSSFGGSGALGGSVAGSRGSRRLASDTSQEIVDQLTQTSSALSRLNSTIVLQATQAEHETLQTRTVTNHNHCHALTLLYYEVVRHYLVRVRLARKQDVVFVKYLYINDFQERILTDAGYQMLTEFNVPAAVRYRRILREVLLNGSLGPCFAALEKLYCAQSDAVARERTAAIPTDDYEMGRLEVRFTTGGQGLDGHSDFIRIYLITEAVLEEDRRIPLWHDGSYGPFMEPLPGTRDRLYRYHHFPDGLKSGPGFIAGGEDIYTLTSAHRICWGRVRGIEIECDNPWDLQRLQVRTAHEDHVWTMVEEDVNHLFGDTASERVRGLGVAPYGPATPEEVLGPLERCCVTGLLEHLNANKTYYMRAIWVNQDAEERARVFEQYQFSITDEQGSRLTDFIENRIVGVTGDYVAFPLTVTSFADSLATEGDNESERIITLPTRGVFAETKLSHCNACETRDVTRYWDWSESPCPKAPKIAPIEAGDRARDIPSVTPGIEGDSNINIVTAPSAPAPSGTSAALEAMAAANIFRDMSASKELAGLLGTLAEKSTNLASKSGSNLFNNYTGASRAIDQAQESGSVSEDDANELRQELLRNLIESLQESAVENGENGNGGEDDSEDEGGNGS